MRISYLAMGSMVPLILVDCSVRSPHGMGVSDCSKRQPFFLYYVLVLPALLAFVDRDNCEHSQQPLRSVQDGCADSHWLLQRLCTAQRKRALLPELGASA